MVINNFKSQQSLGENVLLVYRFVSLMGSYQKLRAGNKTIVGTYITITIISVKTTSVEFHDFACYEVVSFPADVNCTRKTHRRIRHFDYASTAAKCATPTHVRCILLYLNMMNICFNSILNDFILEHNHKCEII